jgi:hypothetical protein
MASSLIGPKVLCPTSAIKWWLGGGGSACLDVTRLVSPPKWAYNLSGVVAALRLKLSSEKFFSVQGDLVWRFGSCPMLKIQSGNFLIRL